jgi:hypothetical protein
VGFDPGTSAQPMPKFSYANQHTNNFINANHLQKWYKKGVSPEFRMDKSTEKGQVERIHTVRIWA